MRRWKAAAALLALASLAACGIQESDVVEAGGAATVAVAPAPEFRMVLYFLGPGGQPVPVVREVGQPVPGTDALEAQHLKSKWTGSGQQPYEQSGTAAFTDMVIAALLAGPAEADTAAGLTTGLPAPGKSWKTPHTEAVGGLTPEGRRTIRIRPPFPVGNLPDAAVQQLVCTAAYAADHGGEVDVSLMGTDGTLPPTRCDT
ncbi:hypothetical protein ACFYUJ_39200 [Streptomyces sp. NPDC004520]|uniref:hypothetical protein n=1 Tax=Streptomyces sp. NPDC004520 TaxID=3364702 RepID=UPI0036C7AA67